MKLTSLLLFLTLFQIQASTYSQNTKITLDLKNVTVGEALDEIESLTEFKFFVDTKKVDLNRVISIVEKRERVSKILKKMFLKTNISFQLLNKQIIIKPDFKKENTIISDLKINKPIEVQREVKGTVTDNTGQLLPGVSVVIKGTTKGTETDFDGLFSLKAKIGDILVFSYVGMQEKEHHIKDYSSIKISLEEGDNQLEEVVLVGYGKLKSKDVTGSVKVLGTKDFNKGVVSSPEQLLKGKIAGVNITSGTGEPGGAVDINIRGVNSIGGGSTPLFVIDGVPVGGSSVGGIGVAGLGQTRPKSPFNFVNSNDIASITILKDASATAIYGTRGANGVVLIETKKGKKGKSILTYDTYLSTSTVANKLDLLTADGYKRETARLGAQLADVRPPESYIEDANANTDWQDLVFRTGIAKSHNLSFSGGSNTSTFNASLGYLSQDGIIKTTGHEKFTGRINVGTKALNDRLDLQLNMAAAKTKDDGQATGGSANASGNLLTSILRANPTSNPYNSDGSINPVVGPTTSPLSYLDAYRDVTNSKSILTNLTASYKLTDALRFKVNLGYENTDADRAVRLIPNANEGGEINEGSISLLRSENENSLVETYLTYTKELGDFNIDALLGYSFQLFTSTGMFASQSGLSTTEIDPIYNIGIGNTLTALSSYANERKLQSYFGRLNIGYKDKLLLTASLRADGSSVFGENNRYGYFPSVAGAWRLSEEDFIADLDFFSDLKLRAGWGETGNQAVPVKVTQASFTSSQNNGYAFNGSSVVNGISAARTPNPDLKWEVTTQVNFGLDFGILNNKITGTVDYFNKKTSDLFLQIAAPVPAVVSKIYKNVDTEIINKGLELALNAYAVSTEDFSLDFGGNIAFIDNTIENLATDIELGGVSGPGASGETSSIYRSGYSAGSFFMQRFLGYDANGTEILSEGREIVGDALPDVTYGFNLNMRYKKADLAMNFNGVTGVDIFNNTARAYSSAASLAQNGSNVIAAYIDPNENPAQAPKTSTRFLEKGDFLRLSNLTVGYNVDVQRIDWMSNLRVYATGQNLFVITDYEGYDPEVNTQGGNVYGVDYAAYPKARTLLLGLSVSF